MTIEEQLKRLIIEKSKSVNKFSRECGVPQSTIATIFTRGVNNANAKSISKICKHLGIDADELMEGRIVKSSVPDSSDEINTKLLTEDNYKRLLGYYQALLDSQGENK